MDELNAWKILSTLVFCCALFDVVVLFLNGLMPVGFPIEAEDTKGNTLLLVAAQNTNRRLIELLVSRGANVNQQNAQGNTALHYAMAYDKTGQLGSSMSPKPCNKHAHQCIQENILLQKEPMIPFKTRSSSARMTGCR